MARGRPRRETSRYLIEIGEWSEERQAELEARIDGEVTSAYKEAVGYGDMASGPYPGADTIFTEVYEEMPWQLEEQFDEAMEG